MTADRDYDEGGESCEAYWKRKQSVKQNRVRGEAELAGPDRDAEDSHYSYGRDGYARPKDRTANSPTKSSTIWDDEAWKDKSD